VLTEIYCRFTIIDYTTLSFLSLKCVYIFLADPVVDTFDFLADDEADGWLRRWW